MDKQCDIQICLKDILEVGLRFWGDTVLGI